jgi:hypothetical protein
MGKDPVTLPEDIYNILSDSNDHEVNEDNVQWAGEVFKTILRSRLQRQERRGLRFSNLGKKDRQIWYQNNAPDKAEANLPKHNFKYLYGDMIEVLLLFLAKEAGHEVTHLQHEVDVDGVQGHTDAVIDGVPVDCKSASAFSYEKFADGGFLFDDPFGYIKQLSGYANELHKEFPETVVGDRAGFLVANKVHGDICFAEIDEYTIDGNKPEPRIAHLRTVIERPEPPVRCYPDKPSGKSGNRELGLGCSYCSYKYECWKDSNGGQGLRKFAYSNGPKWLTKIVREPKVNET